MVLEALRKLLEKEIGPVVPALNSMCLAVAELALH
jgi:hypothetical protein